MKKIIVKSIKEYIEEIQKIYKEIESNRTILFRGQSNSEWEISSTLERANIEEISFKDYYTTIDYFKPELNALGEKFERKVKFPGGYDFDFTDYNPISFNQFPELEYLAYLRQHGFPTPLIDVTQSEYIALFFACENYKENANAKVFVLQSDLWSSGGTNQPEIHLIGHYLNVDKRHIAQQSEYLIPAFFRTGTDCEWMFTSFSNAKKDSLEFGDIWRSEHPDYPQKIYEIEIDASAKKDILLELERMNINHYTLYLNEDALIQKLKFDFEINYMKNRG